MKIEIFSSAKTPNTLLTHSLFVPLRFFFFIKNFILLRLVRTTCASSYAYAFATIKARRKARYSTHKCFALLYFALLKQTLCFSFRWLDLTWLDYPSLNKTDFCSFSFSLSFCSFSSRPVDFASCFSRLSITTLHS